MKVVLEPGRYVVAVSGGVDSMALLYMLRTDPQLKLTVAHFDHGIREDSREDRLLVQQTAKEYGLPFVYAEGKLGRKASEAAARRARYEFLHKTRRAAGARAIITAHHKDDVLETAIINLLRGTGRKGLASLQSTDGIKRPLLDTPKSELRRYADEHGLNWREDSTNADPAYLRNYVRATIIKKFTAEDRQKLHAILAAQAEINRQADELLAGLLEVYAGNGRLDRKWFIGLPHVAALEVMAAWLRCTGAGSFDKKMLERLVRAAKILRAGQLVSISRNMSLRVGKEHLALVTHER